MGSKLKTHCEWVLWHRSSLCQLILDPTWPKCQLTSWKSVSKKPCTWVIIILPITVTSQWPPWRLKSPALDCLLNCLFEIASKKTAKPAFLALCEGNPPVTGGFPWQRANNAENVPIAWRRHDLVENKKGYMRQDKLLKKVGSIYKINIYIYIRKTNQQIILLHYTSGAWGWGWGSVDAFLKHLWVPLISESSENHQSCLNIISWWGPLKSHAKYHIQALKDTYFIQRRTFKSS